MVSFVVLVLAVFEFLSPQKIHVLVSCYDVLQVFCSFCWFIHLVRKDLQDFCHSILIILIVLPRTILIVDR